MKKKPFIKIFIAFLIVLGALGQVHADHITGGEMYYRYVGFQGGNHIYRGNLRLLMRCSSGRVFPNPIIIGVFSKESGARLNDISVPLGSQETISLQNTDPCISNPPNVCYEVATYIFDIAVPETTQGFIISAQVNFRVSGLANLQFGSSGIGATYTAEIPGNGGGSTESLKNNSAQFTGTDLVVVCAGSPFTYSFQATDADGDALRYSLCAAYQTGTTGGGGQALPPQPPPYQTVPYGPGFEGSFPLGARVSVNPLTGFVSGIAPATGFYVLTVCVEEIRNGVVIATQRKDIQLNIASCTVAAAILQDEYLLCGETNEITFENLSISSLIQSYSWRLTDLEGRIVSTSGQPKFTHRFADTGTYRIILQTNVGLICPSFSAAPVRVYPGMKAGFDYQGLCFEYPTQFSNQSTTRYGAINRWQWNLGEPQNSQNLPDKANPAITYGLEGAKNATLVAFNNNGCRDSISRQLRVSKEPAMQFSFKDTLICLPDTLQLQAFGAGDFSWATVPGILSGANTSLLRVAPLVTTLYAVKQQQGNCTALDTVRVQVTQTVSLSSMPDTTICTGDEIPLRVNSDATKYQWAPPATLNNASVMQPVARPQSETEYRLMASISKCTATASIKVRTVPYPVVSASGPQFICFGDSAQLVSKHAGARVQWVPSNSLNAANISNPVASPIVTTTYTVIVNENNGCPKPGTDTVRITVEPPINLAVTRDTSVVVGQPLALNASGASQYLWSPLSNISNGEIPNPIFNFSQPTEGITYEVLGYNNAGCRDSLTVRIRVFASGASIYVPTAFTPNDDGLNETLKPTLAGMRQLNFFRIFNRYGQVVFQTSILGAAWDGRFNGKPQASGTFAWMVQAIDFEGKVVQQKGSSLLVR